MHYIIALTGPAGVGKSSYADALATICYKRNFNCLIQPLALPIKTALLLMHPTTRSSMAELSLELGSPEAIDAVEDLFNWYKTQDFAGDKTWRDAAQLLGTEWGRDLIARNIWTTFLLEELESYESACLLQRSDFFSIVPDCRFINELDELRSWVAQHPGRRMLSTWRIQRQTDLFALSEKQQAHASETESKLLRADECIVLNEVSNPEDVTAYLQYIAEARLLRLIDED